MAVVALAGKLAGILYALWRRGGSCQPWRASSVPSSTPAHAMEEALELLR